MNFFSIFNEYVVMALVIVLAVVTTWITKRKLAGRKQPVSKKATGIILSMEKVALAHEHHIEVKMLVMVMPEKSRNFVGELVETFLLTDLLLLKIGDKIPVEYSAGPRLTLVRAAI